MYKNRKGHMMKKRLLAVFILPIQQGYLKCQGSRKMNRRVTRIYQHNQRWDSVTGGHISKTTGVVDKSIKKSGKIDQTINCKKIEYVPAREKKILKKRARNRSCNNQAITEPKISFMENMTPKSECGMA